VTTSLPRLVGMVHLFPLPGAPGYRGSMDEVVAAATEDAGALADAGFPALMVENFGDAPFRSDHVDPETIAAQAVVVSALTGLGLPIGVNVLRNDALGALGIAAATGARFIRVNVLTGLMFTDQGPINGRADEVMRARARLAPGVEVWADVLVKHATPPPGLEPGQAAADTVERGLADAVIVSGGGTGVVPDLEVARQVAGAVPPGTRVVIGSGATVDNLAALTDVADTVIVGSHIKYDGQASHRVDPLRAKLFAQRAQDEGLL